MGSFCVPKVLTSFKCQLTCLLLPILLLPLPLLIEGSEALCGYIVLIMAYLWVTETMPLAVTALIPVVAFPLLGVMEATEISSAYLSDSNFVFFGSMIVAIAVESSRLHERIALKILLLAGPNPRWYVFLVLNARLLLGFIVATSFISMWISNTACTMMMVPIVVAVIRELDMCRRRQSDPEQAHRFPSICTFSTTINFNNNAEEIVDLEEVPESQLRVYKALLLCICFSASIGGTGTLIGTTPNIVLNAYLHKWYGCCKSPVNFSSYLLYSLPQMLILMGICWLWLQAVFIGFDPGDRSHDGLVKRMLRKKYEELGNITYFEKSMVFVFCLLLFLWMSRRIWSIYLPNGNYVTDGTVAMFVGFLLFILPSENPLKEAQRKVSSSSSHDQSSAPTAVVRNSWSNGTIFAKNRSVEPLKTIMTWDLMRDKFSWSTLVLLGGGFAMAAGVEESGLSDYIGSRLALIDYLPEYAFIAIACFVTTCLTEFTSNVATASIFIPMVASIAKTRGTNPLIYVLPVTLASSYAFMFPAGTPPNSIVFSVKILKVTDMITGGIALNVGAFFVSQIMTYTYGRLVFQFDMDSPSHHLWNSTLTVHS